MAVRTAKAHWNGTLQEGRGTMALGGGAFEGQYSFGSRFEDGPGTNPEELIGAALAGCFSMALAGNLGRGGYEPESVETGARVHIEKVEGGFAVTRIDLTSSVRASGVDEEEFQRIAAATKEGCPISKVLAAEISLDATLESA